MNEKEFKVFTPQIPDFGTGKVTEELVAWAKETNALLAQMTKLQANQQTAIERLSDEVALLRSRL